MSSCSILSPFPCHWIVPPTLILVVVTYTNGLSGSSCICSKASTTLIRKHAGNTPNSSPSYLVPPTARPVIRTCGAPLTGVLQHHHAAGTWRNLSSKPDAISTGLLMPVDPSDLHCREFRRQSFLATASGARFWRSLGCHSTSVWSEPRLWVPAARVEVARLLVELAWSVVW